MAKLSCFVEADSSYFVDAVSELTHDEIIELIMAIDSEVADLGFTERLAARLNASIEAENADDISFEGFFDKDTK